MTIARGTLPRRPAPSARSRERYRAEARASRARRSGSRSRRYLSLIAWPLMAVLGAAVIALAAPTVGMGADSLRRDIEAALANAFPTSGEATIELERVSGSVQPDPIVDQLPDFTKERTIVLQAHVPVFALAEERDVRIMLNGSVIGRAKPDEGGRFVQQLVLRDGENAVVLSLMQGETVISETSATTVYDATAPTLTVVRPAAGAEIEGDTVVVEGKTEPGARVTVNERNVVAAPDGSFSESFTAAAGTLPVVIVARDQAGNETKSELAVTVKPAAAGFAGQRVLLSLDRASVRPGEPVVAEAVVLQDGAPRSGVRVTLFVGVVQIGTGHSDAKGVVRISFAAPTTEGEIGIVMIGADATGRATLTVAR